MKTMKLPIITLSPLFLAPIVSTFAPTKLPLRPSSIIPLFAHVDVNERAQRNLGPFFEWATSNGVKIADGFQVTSEDGVDFSVITTENLAAGQPIVGVPAFMVLSSSNAKAQLEAISEGGVKAAVDQLARLGGGQTITKFYLFLQILVEFEKGDQSPFFPWLDSLPRLFFNSASMTNFCYECLPPYVFRLSREERVKFDNFIQALKKVDIVSQKVKENKALCQWAFNVATTRSFGEQGGELKIAPMADMFNHGTNTEVEIKYDEQGNCVAFATYDVPAGSPLRMSYGCPSNPSYFFTKYGFLDQSSPATFCKILDIQSTPELRDIGLDYSRMLFYKESGDITEEVWDVVLYGKVLATKPDVRRQFYEAHMSGNTQLKRAIHMEYMLETSTELKRHVDMFLKTIDELCAKAVGKDLNEHPRLPLIIDHNQFVKSTFEKVKARLDPMVQQLANERQMA